MAMGLLKTATAGKGSTCVCPGQDKIQNLAVSSERFARRGWRRSRRGGCRHVGWGCTTPAEVDRWGGSSAVVCGGRRRRVGFLPWAAGSEGVLVYFIGRQNCRDSAVCLHWENYRNVRPYAYETSGDQESRDGLFYLLIGFF